jgi:dCTP deaminase
VPLLRQEDLAAALDADLDERLVVTPLLDRSRQLGPASIDLRLGTTFLALQRTKSAALDPGKPLPGGSEASELYERTEVPLGESLLLHPGDLLLGATLEYIRLPTDMGAYVIGRSSWGRLGLIVAAAILVQPGFAGCLTLELANEGENPIHLYPGARVAQLAVHRLAMPTDAPYKGVYESPIGPEAPHLAKDLQEIEWMLELRESLDEVTRGVPEPPSS